MLIAGLLIGFTMFLIPSLYVVYDVIDRLKKLESEGEKA